MEPFGVAAEQPRVRSAKVDVRSKVVLSLHSGLFASGQSGVWVQIRQLWATRAGSTSGVGAIWRRGGAAARGTG